ncbi:MAG: amidohydrolase family protein [Myxococcota bacterium]
MSESQLRVRSTRVWAHADAPVEPADVVLDGAFITAVEPVAPAAVGVIDLGDQLVTPAFVDAHTHLSLTCLRTLLPDEGTEGNVVEDFFYRVEHAVEDADIRAFTRVGAYECLQNGIGLVWDHYYGGVAVAEGLRDAGLCGVVAPTLQDLDDRPGVPHLESQWQATLELDDESWRAHGIGAALGPHATDTVSDALWERVAATSAARSLPVHMHLAQSIEEYERCEARRGTTPARHLAVLGVFEAVPSLVAAHGIFIRDDELASLAPTSSTLVWCPRAAAQFAFAARPDHWSRAGVNWVFGTDAAVTNDSHRMQDEFASLIAYGAGRATGDGAYAAFLEGAPAAPAQLARQQHFEATKDVIEPRSILARTWNRAGDLHPKLRVGRLQPGSLANLAVWDLEAPALWPGRDPARALVYADAPSALVEIWCAGVRHQTPRATASAEYRDARTEAERRLELLLQRS